MENICGGDRNDKVGLESKVGKWDDGENGNSNAFFMFLLRGLVLDHTLEHKLINRYVWT